EQKPAASASAEPLLTVQPLSAELRAWLTAHNKIYSEKTLQHFGIGESRYQGEPCLVIPIRWGDWDDAAGKRHYRKLSPYKDQARDLLQKLVAEAIEEKQLSVTRKDAKLKFSDVVSAYINYCKTINDEKTWRGKEKHLKRFGCVLRPDILIGQIKAE